jgi:transposase
MAGRKSRLSDPDFAKAVAEAYVSGMNRDEMAEHLECHKDSIAVWIKDPRVTAHASRFTLERIQRITRRIDSEVEGRLAHVSNWKLEDLLKVRKEYLERSLKVAEASAAGTAETTEELAEAMDQSPDLAAALRQLVGAE